MVQIYLSVLIQKGRGLTLDSINSPEEKEWFFVTPPVSRNLKQF
jgi:hypothetical protein